MAWWEDPEYDPRPPKMRPWRGWRIIGLILLGILSMTVSVLCHTPMNWPVGP